MYSKKEWLICQNIYVFFENLKIAICDLYVVMKNKINLLLSNWIRC